MSDQVRVNGNGYSWGSIRLKLDGEDFFGFTSIAFSDKRERVKGYGMGRHHAPRIRSSGKYTADAVKLVGWKSSVATFRDALAARSTDGTSYGNVEFEAVVLYAEGDEPPQTVQITGCVWSGNSTSEEENADPLKEEIEIDCMAIRRNGKTLFDSTEGSPV